MSFFKSNIDRTGRIVRGVLAALLALAGFIFFAQGWTLVSVILGLLALFVFVEAVCGWCWARACGIRTKF